MKDKNSHQYSKNKKEENNQNNKTRLQVSLDVEKKPQALAHLVIFESTLLKTF